LNNVLITGGAGFIGVNSALHFARRGWKVTLLDNLSRRGAVENLKWIRGQIDANFCKSDVRDAEDIVRLVRDTAPDLVIHLAGQVSVTASVDDPRADFEINALGGLNLLEAIRTERPTAFFINASTNKVYGALESRATIEGATRHAFEEPESGVDETQPIDFHSPYGCSKGAADLYTLDYARIYGLDATTFRQSCIYGPRQFGAEEQGWLAWFAIAAVTGAEITVFGDGKQMRDVLHVTDLARAYEAAFDNRPAARGQAFNIGGGPDNTLSLLELLEILGRELNRNIEVRHGARRPGDQAVFVCDIGKARERLGWRPEVDPARGVRELIGWVGENRALFG
jgi:CDP-paratose 2-epimerase